MKPTFAPSRLAASLIFGLAAAIGSASADPNVSTDGDVIAEVSGTFVSAVFTGNYGAVTVSGAGNESNSFTLIPSFAGVFALSGTTTPGMYQLTNNAGGIANNTGASFFYDDAAAAEFGKIGNGAIRLIAQPAAYEPSRGIGGNIVWDGYPDTFIQVQGNGSTTAPAPTDTLAPPGFRMAQLSGIAAVSYGDQTVTSGTINPGGNVTIHATGTISMANTDATQITAGVSAASANGTGTTYGDHGPSAVTTTLANGVIENSAQAGIGLMAVATGAQFQPGTSTTAYGGNITSGLSNAQISLTGTTGIGLYAVSEVYVPSEPPKHSSVQSGTVTVSVDANSSITTGNAGSLFSMGVLAVAAGTDLLINPFASQTVNGNGQGSGGFVQITNSGTITTHGMLSIGLAGLSLGGAGIVTTNSGTASESYLGNSGTSTNGQGGDVTIVNHGLIDTTGQNGFGVVALSTGGGGIVNNEIAAAEASGLVVGNFSSSTSGSASNGGVITGTNTGGILTGYGLGAGEASHGFVAQSIGGGGGNAGGSQAAWFVGDKGGQGGTGGAVNLTFTEGSYVVTADENSIGVLAQSIGGGGGNGANAKGLFVAVGGRGGAGGDGGDINIDIDGILQTADDYSSALIAQSIGGGGGHGGTAKSVGVFIDVGQGGRGGGGGNGGTVNASLGTAGSIWTFANNAAAMHLQSIGGGGGTGGASSASSAAGGTGEGVTLNFNLSAGGTGGSGGLGGTVSGINEGEISTGLGIHEIVTIPNVEGADSVGMLAQSIGGGGGHGGNALGKSLALSTGTGSLVAVKFDLALGGSGGSGQHGGEAGLANLGRVQTWGDGSHAMLAQSIGGGGGTGADSTAASALSAQDGVAVTLTMALGGSGGGGGDGSRVVVSNSTASASIETYGQDANGIIAQSIGGGGGSGGLGNAALHTPTTGTSSAFSINTQLGAAGAGGGGGNGGGVEVLNEGNITTVGSGALGILAQAIGGGGGNAGGGSAAGSNNSLTINLALGLSGGAGGSASGTNSFGQSVTVQNTGTISTKGGGASAIVAQSIGGGGGKAGSADADAGIDTLGSIANLIFSSTGYTSKIALGAAIGGTGGEGGAGGTVQVDQSNLISTQGAQAYGILAQSISGGGGQGGAATAASNPGLFDGYDGTLQFAAIVAVGGQGGDAHDGGDVMVNQSGGGFTSGYGAHAIVAQSIAGGGGVGADGTVDANSTVGLGVGVNNHTSGTAANGGSVTVNQTGFVTTTGGDASGIVAQSIAGGGGLGSTGGDRKLFSPSISAGLLPVHVDFTLGMNLSSTYEADGGTVTVNTGTGSQIATVGDLSHGIVAQSIGAGGGKSSAILGTNSGAYADFSSAITTVINGTSVTSAQGLTLGANEGQGHGGAVGLALANTTISTGVSGSTGFGSVGLLAQSIGGGGGLATIDTTMANGTISLGSSGSANSGGHGGLVHVTGTAAISTEGDSAHAVVLQSIGGGGGVATVGSSRAFSGTAPAGASVNQQLGSRESWGHGNTVTYNAQFALQTNGDNAFGLVAQSIGGGGGIITSQVSGSTRLGMTHSSTNSYDGGTVSLTLQSGADITTTGNGAHGLVAQSIGGGGGIASPATTGALSTIASPDLVNPGTAKGAGGEVSLTIGNNITTSGSGAYGVIAQTISGGGGLAGGFAGGTGSSDTINNATITVNQSASSVISATGAGATGIFAQNISPAGTGTGGVQISISGTVLGGGGAGAHGIWVDQGNSTYNTVTIHAGGEVSAVNADNLSAIYYTGTASGSRLDVFNEGTVKGSVSLSGSHQGTFNNQNGGTFYAEGEINATVLDDGVFIVGVDPSTAATVSLQSYEQGIQTPLGPEGIQMDVFSLASYDKITFQDVGFGQFEGNLTVNFAAGYVAQLHDTFTLIGAAGLGTNSYVFGSEQVTGLAAGIFCEFRQEDGQYVLEIVGVPEPSSALLLVFGLPLLLRRRDLKN